MTLYRRFILMAGFVLMAIAVNGADAQDTRNTVQSADGAGKAPNIGVPTGTVEQALPTEPPKPNEVYIDIKPVEEMVFKGDKRACATKAKFYTVTLSQYGSGESIANSGETKIIQELMTTVTDDIRMQGVQGIKIAVMREFAECYQNAPPNSDPEREARFVAEYEGCAKLDKLMVNVLRDIERKTNIDMAQAKYKNTNINLENTTYKRVEDPVPLFVGKVYDASEKKDFEHAVDTAFAISTACKM